jgi:molecular chaperone HscB
LLEEVFELNMALEELRSGDEDARPALESAKTKFDGMLAEIDDELAGLFAKYDAAKDQAALTEIRSVLNRRRYIENLLRDVRNALGA